MATCTHRHLTRKITSHQLIFHKFQSRLKFYAFPVLLDVSTNFNTNTIMSTPTESDPRLLFTTPETLQTHDEEAPYHCVATNAELQQQLEALVQTFPPADQELFRQTSEQFVLEAKRQFRREYEFGKKILQVRPLFPWGTKSLFVFWQTQLIGLREGMGDRMKRLAVAFSPFEDHAQFDELERVTPMIRDEISKANVPAAAQKDFFEQVVAGRVFTKKEVVQLIESYRTPNEVEEARRFGRRKEEVALWGELGICEEIEEYKYYLVERVTEEQYFFKNLVQVAKAYKKRIKLHMEHYAEELKLVLSPHWRVLPAGTRQRPYQLEVESQLPNFHKSYFILNPVAVDNWWQQEAESWTRNYLERCTIEVTAEKVNDVDSQTVPSLPADPGSFTPSCRNCHFFEPEHEGNTDGFIHCRFYNTSIAEERTTEMPTECGKWRDINGAAPLSPVQAEPMTNSSQAQKLPYPRSSMDLNSPVAPINQGSSGTGLQPIITFDTFANWILESDDDALDRIEALIQERRRQQPSTSAWRSSTALR